MTELLLFSLNLYSKTDRLWQLTSHLLTLYRLVVCFVYYIFQNAMKCYKFRYC
jgi:hypothetical protein